MSEYVIRIRRSVAYPDWEASMNDGRGFLLGLHARGDTPFDALRILALEYFDETGNPRQHEEKEAGSD